MIFLLHCYFSCVFVKSKFDCTKVRHILYFCRDIILYQGSDHEDYKKGGKCHSLNPKVKKGTQEADKALKLSVEDRLKLVVDLQPSSDEEEEEDMDVEGTLLYSP